MTLEELADLTSDKLKALSNKKLLEILSPFFKVTRPEMIVRKKKSEPELILPVANREALALMREAGVDLSFLKRKKR